ncbi:MAG: Hpt domain-containing protein [Treponema sp.]|nr:Hpt domain-containing protein [Treponema sp.]
MEKDLIIPGVDTIKGTAMTGGTAASYRKVLSMFCKDVEERLQRLRFFLFEGMRGNKFPEKHLAAFTTQVHAMKSASGTLGAAEISMEAARLEDAGKTGDLNFVWDNLGGFVEHLTELSGNIRAVLETEPGEAVFPSNPMVDISIFNKLAEALKSQNISEIDRIMDELNGNILDSETKEILEQISDQVLMTEFESAIKTVNELIKKNS